MTSRQGRWELSYYIGPIGWSGTEVTFDREDARKQLETVKAAGIEWVGFNGINLMEPAACDVRAAVGLVAEWMRELGIRVSSFHFAGPTFESLDRDQARVRENMATCVDLFKAFRAKAFVVHANWILGENTTEGVERAYEDEVAKHGADAVLRTVADNLRAMASEAAKYDIRLAIENMPHIALGMTEDLPALVEAIDEPNVGYCLDSGHAHMCGQDLQEWVKVMGGKLFETHLHDNRGSGDEHMSPSFGTINWIDLIRALDEIGFPGPMTFETGGWPGYETTEGYRLAMAWWRACEKIALG